MTMTDSRALATEEAAVEALVVDVDVIVVELDDAPEPVR